MTRSLAWLDVTIMAAGALVAIALMVLILMAEEALKARRHRRQPAARLAASLSPSPIPPDEG